MYDKTVTVFNYYESRTLDKAVWFPHVIKGVDLIVDKAANIEKTGLQDSDSAKLHIKHSNGMIGALKYLDPKAWSKQVYDYLDKTVTFNEGTDFFMMGEYPEEPIDDDEYREGFYHYLNEAKDHVYKITTVGKYDLIPHFEIGGA